MVIGRERFSSFTRIACNVVGIYFMQLGLLYWSEMNFYFLLTVVSLSINIVQKLISPCTLMNYLLKCYWLFPLNILKMKLRIMRMMRQLRVLKPFSWISIFWSTICRVTFIRKLGWLCRLNDKLVHDISIKVWYEFLFHVFFSNRMRMKIWKKRRIRIIM